MGMAALIHLSVLSASAEVELPAIIGSNMVILSGEPANFWGWADEGENITIRQSGNVLATAVGMGKDTPWRAKLPAFLPGSVADIEVAGSNTLTLTNLVAGEVWLFSGQSNMAMPLKKGPWNGWGGVLNADAEVAAATDNQIRLFIEMSPSARTPQSRHKGEWWMLTPETAPQMSGVACFFSRQLRSDLKAPVGAIISAVGNTAVELWTPPEPYLSDPEIKRINTKVQELKTELLPAIRQDQQAAGLLRKQTEEAAAKGEPSPPRPPSVVPADKSALLRSLSAKLNVGGLFNAKIHPLAPFNIRGIVWYQGESNAPRPENYALTLEFLIKGWRAEWDKPLPFIIITLAGWGRPVAWEAEPTAGAAAGSFPLIREAQIKVAASVPHCGIVSAVDVGDSRNIHPPNKQVVGQRTALWALAKVYGMDVRYEGPRIEKVEFAAGKAVVSLGGDAEGLALKNPSGFELAGADRQFAAAVAERKGTTIEVTAPGIVQPTSLRYAFLYLPECSIYNSAGLPALPYRTDDWPLRPVNKSWTQKL